MNLYVSNLHQNVIESDLQRLFTSFGEIDSIRLVRDKLTNRSRGSAFVIMPIEKQGKSAIMNLDGHDLKGKTISVSEIHYDPAPKAF